MSVVRERRVSCLLPNGRLLFAVLLQLEVTALVRTLSPLYFLQTTWTLFLTSNSFEFIMLSSESMASDLQLQSCKSWDAGDVLAEHSVFRVLGTWSSDQQALMMMTLIRALSHQCLLSLIRYSLLSLIISSELQVLGNWRRSTELLVFRILWHLVLQNRRSFLKTSFFVVFFLSMIFRTSNPCVRP